MKSARADTLILFILVIICIPVLRSEADLQLGGNFNEHAEMIRWELLQQSGTEVIRGFIPASPFLRGERQLATDQAVQNLKQGVVDGYKVILCLKWDFKKGGWRVPAQGSAEERKSFEWAAALLQEVGDVAVLETINEIMVDTVEEDVMPGKDGTIPMVLFQKRLLDYLDKAIHDLPPVYMGGFTRLDLEKMQTHPVTADLLKWINADPRISGVNYHIHAPEVEIFEKAAAYIQGQVPDKPFIVTEFSLVWKYKRAMKHPVGRFARGRAFAEANGIDPELTVREFINQAIDKPIAQDQWQAFLNSQYWYDPDFLDKACRIMEAHGVRYAAYAFQQGSSGRGKLGPNSNPWILNPIYLPSTTKGIDNQTAVNVDFMAAYRNWR